MKNLLITLLTLAPMCAVAQEASNPDEAYFRHQIEVLASDSLGGRKPLSTYEPNTINYIADQFRNLGLQPINGNSYFQDVPLVDVTLRTKGDKITVNGKNGKTVLHDYYDYVVWTAHSEHNIRLKNAELVFVGFGINAPEYGWNDYEGIDVRGKVVVALVNDPGYYDQTLFKGKEMTYYGRWIYKFEEASRQGAAGILVVHDDAPATYKWNVVTASWHEHNLELINDKGNKDLVSFKGWLTRTKAEELFKNAGYTYDVLLNKALKKGFRPLSLNSRADFIFENHASTGVSHNVAAVLPGADLKDEYVIYSAHWDHFGMGKPVDGDSIYNGASDNASGVAAIMAIAKKFRDLGIKPRRSVVFLSFTAEEAVLLGSQHYVTHPLVPLEKTSAVLNFDGVAPQPATSEVIDFNHTSASKYVEQAATVQGRKYISSKRGTGYRSDHFSFNRYGVPTIVTNPGKRKINPQAIERDRKAYHQPSDEYSASWDVSGSLQSIGLAFYAGWKIADADSLTTWNDDAPYCRQ